jgi:flagellar basal-body rod protein FlgB
MIAELGGMTSVLLKAALDAGALRQVVFAHNIAAASTPGMVPLRVSFEERLTGLAARVGSADRLEPYVPPAEVVEDTSAISSGDTRVMLDFEAARMAQNVLHYQALARGYSRRMELMGLVVNDGRR